MFWKSNAAACRSPGSPALCPHPLRIKAPYLVAARADTDHTTGAGQVAITGRYDSKKDSFAVDAAYALDDDNTFYVAYGVTDENISALGLESGFPAFGRRATVDMTYLPANDAATAKLSIRQGNVKLTASSYIDTVRSSRLASHSERYELDAKLSVFESLKMGFDAKTKATTCKISRKLDPKNKLDAQYVYNDSSRKYVSLKFSHAYSKVHRFSADINYGFKKYTIEWNCDTDNGPWTISTSFPFNSSPHSGDWHIKRRFEF